MLHAYNYALSLLVLCVASTSLAASKKPASPLASSTTGSKALNAQCSREQLVFMKQQKTKKHDEVLKLIQQQRAQNANQKRHAELYWLSKISDQQKKLTAQEHFVDASFLQLQDCIKLCPQFYVQLIDAYNEAKAMRAVHQNLIHQYLQNTHTLIHQREQLAKFNEKLLKAKIKLLNQIVAASTEN